MADWWLDPFNIAIFAVVGWLVTQTVSIFVAQRVIWKAKQFSEDQRAKIQDHFEGRLLSIEARIPTDVPTKADLGLLRADIDSQMSAFQSDLKDTVTQIGADIGTLRTELPRQLDMKAMSMAGVEQRQIQKMLTENGADLEQAMSLQEAAASGDPEMMRLAALKKVVEWQPSPKYAKEHPILALALEIGKPKVAELIESSFPGASTPSVSASRGTKPAKYI